MRNTKVLIEYYGHSCFMLSSPEYSIVTDPYSPNSVPGLKPIKLTADSVFCSHGHHDHNSVDSVTLSGKKVSEKVFSFRSFETAHDDCGGKLRGKNLIYEFHFGDCRIVHFGDCGCIPSDEILNALRDADCVLIPIGGFYTIESETARKIIELIRPFVVIPMHYRTVDSGYSQISDASDFIINTSAVVLNESSYLVGSEECKAKTIVLKPINEEK